MRSNLVPLRELAPKLGMHITHVKKWAAANGIEPSKTRFRRQLELAVIKREAEHLIQMRKEHGFAGTNGNGSTNLEIGCFYLIQLIPDVYPTRFKLGFAASLQERVRAHRIAAPTAKTVKSWPCRRTWESAAMACLSKLGCKHVGGEVFDCKDVGALIKTGDQFFSMMPSLI